MIHPYVIYRKSARVQSAGVLSLEAAIVASLLVFTLVTVGGWLKFNAERNMDQNAADHLNQVFQGAQHWFGEHYAAIEMAANPSVRYPYPIWKSALPAALSSTNIYGQRYSMRVYKEPSGQLDMAVVTEGGEAIAQRSLVRIAKWIGGAGGYISRAAPADAQGAFGGWRIAMAKLGGTPGGGHIVAAAFFESARAIQNFLYRGTVFGHPEANRMDTAIDMGGHDVRNGGAIRARMAEFEHHTVTGGWFKTLGDGGWYNQKWQGGWTMNDPEWVRSVADKGVYTGGPLQGGTVRAQGRLSSGEYMYIEGIAQEEAPCAPNGLIGRDGVGALLACQSGIWRASNAARGMGGWQQVGLKGRAEQDGFLVATSCHNCALAGYTSGVQRFAVAARDKYGQGQVSGTMPVARGEIWELTGAAQVWLMRLSR